MYSSKCSQPSAVLDEANYLRSLPERLIGKADNDDGGGEGCVVPCFLYNVLC